MSIKLCVLIAFVYYILTGCSQKILRDPVNHLTPGGVNVWIPPSRMDDWSEAQDQIIDAAGVPIGWRVIVHDEDVIGYFYSFESRELVVFWVHGTLAGINDAASIARD